MSKIIKISIYNRYANKAEVLTSNGLAVLDNICISCKTTEELNGNYTLDATFIIDKDGIYKNIEEESILKVRMDYGDEIFRISSISKNNKNLNVFARQLTIADTLDIYLSDVRPEGLNGISALYHMLENSNEYKSNYAYAKNLTLYSDISTLTTAYYQNMCLYQAIHDCDQSFINRWGGEVLRRAYQLSILSHVGTDRGFQIRSRKNLTGFNQNTNMDSVVTRIKPQGFNGITIDGYVDSEYINSYPKIKTSLIKYENVKVKDENNDEGYNTLAEAQVELKRLAKLEYSKNNIDKLQADYKINFVQLEKTEEYKNYAILEQVYLGDTVTVIEDKLGINVKVRVIKKTYNILKEKVENLELSNHDLKREPISIKKIASEIEKLPSTDDVTIIAKENATNIIKTGVKDSYVILNEDEILIMNTKNINTATKVWRFNSGGLGYSNTGYDGTFGTAITMDGAIVADFITTGVLNANLIKTGILKSFNGLSWINMQNGTFNFANKLIHDGNSTKFTGDVITYTDNGNKAIEIVKQMLRIYDWENGSNNPVGSLYSSRVGGDERKKTIVLANAENALMSLSYHSDNNVYYPYIHFDEQNLLGNNCAITFQRHFALKNYKAFFGDNNKSQISGSNTTLDFVVLDGGGINFKNHSGKHFLYITDNSGYKVNADSLQVNGDFNVIGNKNAIQKTEHYGTRSVHCYEMADTYWGDLGEGIINKQGECIVYIEDVFREMINTNINYHVFTQTYEGNITSIKRCKDYFIVIGEPNTSFSWELKARRKGFENNRLQDANFTLENNITNLVDEIKETDSKTQEYNIRVEDNLNKKNNLEDLI